MTVTGCRLARPMAGAAVAAVVALLVAGPASAEDGYELWLRYRPIADAAARTTYPQGLSGLIAAGPFADAADSGGRAGPRTGRAAGQAGPARLRARA